MQFMVLGKYSNEGLAGFIQNPNDDRRAAISSMMEKAGGKLIDLHLTRGEYDIVAIGEVDSFEDIAAVKLLVASSGAVENLTILEMIDMNSIANKAAAIAGAYRAPSAQLRQIDSRISCFNFCCGLRWKTSQLQLRQKRLVEKRMVFAIHRAKLSILRRTFLRIQLQNCSNSFH